MCTKEWSIDCAEVVNLARVVEIFTRPNGLEQMWFKSKLLPPCLNFKSNSQLCKKN